MHELTDSKIRTAVARDKPLRLYDGAGLYLEVRVNGSRWWRFKYRFGGKAKLLSFGTYPEVPLKAAREKLAAARQLVAAGVDPSDARKAEKASRVESATSSFEALAREWHATVHTPAVSEGHAARTLIRLEQDVFPHLGKRPVREMLAPEILQALRRVEARGAIETAHRELQAIGQVLRFAIATGRADRDVSADLRGALRPFRTEHMAAITDPRRAGELLRAIDGYKGTPVVRSALRLAPLVFVRPGELRAAAWEEFDLEEAVWRIPSVRMKRSVQEKASGKPHLVPLSRQALEILRDDLQPLTGHRKHVFPSTRGDGRVMSDNTILAALRRLGFSADEMTGHGFRALARTMLVERLGVEESVIEAQLAHAVRDSLGRAYNRAQFVDQRREMMQQWADYLDQLRGDAPVPQLRAA